MLHTIYLERLTWVSQGQMTGTSEVSGDGSHKSAPRLEPYPKAAPSLD
jgi:hypothetical protein